jgi:hypothetical protein
MSNKELILVIWSLIGSLSETNHPQFKGIASKKRGELLLILQQIKDIHNGIDNSEMERWFERKTSSNTKMHNKISITPLLFIY